MYMYQMSSVLSWILKQKNVFLIGYSLEQKGYRCYNPVTWQLHVSRDVVFDKMSSWYNAEKGCGADLDDNVVVENVRQDSQVLSGPRESSCSKSVEKSWSTGKPHVQVAPNVSWKGKEKIGEPHIVPNILAGHSFVDGDSSGSEFSLDDELGILAMRTPGVKKAMEGMNAKLCRSTGVKNPVQRLSYDS